MLYSDMIIGAAIFDLSGLPNDYFASTDIKDVSWVQTIFQALGLQTLLASSLRLEGFRYVIVHSQDYRAIVVRQKTRYIALLLHQSDEPLPDAFMRWVQEFEPSTLKLDPRFSTL